jgi:hypothetical protein
LFYSNQPPIFVPTPRKIGGGKGERKNAAMTIVGQAQRDLNTCYENLEKLLTERENFDKMLKYAGKYEISIQFWGDSNTNVFIAKDGIDLYDFGGLDPSEAIAKIVEYLDRINKVKQ